MTVVQLLTGSPNLGYTSEGAYAHIESGALTVRQTTAPPAWTGIGSVILSTGSISVDVTVADYVSIVGSPNYNLPVIGSVQISNNTLDVNTTTADYISIVGSPNYSLPIIGSVQVSSLVGALPAGTANIGDVDIASIAAGDNNIGNVDIVTLPSLPAGTALIGSVIADIVGLSTSDYISIVGSPNYSLPVIGSVQVSSLIGALPAGTNNIGDVDIASAIPAGTNLIGSVVADIVGLTTSDYISVVGSPNYSLPVIGSVEVSSMRNPWGGTGSIVDNRMVQDGSSLTFAWVGPVTGSVLGIPPTGSRFNITSVVMSASGQGITTMFFDSNNNANRLARAYLANFGGFVSNYGITPFRGPLNGSLMITTAATGFTPVGDVTVDFRMSA